MMFERFTKTAREVVLQAMNVEAAALGARTVEAEHLLLALSQTIGVEHDTLIKALEAETAASLNAVGVSLRPPPSPSQPRQPRMGASAKIALHRALEMALARGDREIRAEHVALGVLAADVGTVPRALAIAGLDREGLAAKL